MAGARLRQSRAASKRPRGRGASGGRHDSQQRAGHTDLNGPATAPNVKSWNAAHPSRGPDGGCSQKDLISTGGDGLLYCFAVN